MNPTRRKNMTQDLTRLATRVDSRATLFTEKLEEWSHGHPTGNPSGSGTPDRTGTLALTHDPHQQQLADFDAHIVQAHKSLSRALRLMETATNTIAIENPIPPCASCARIKDHHGRPTQTPSHRNSLCQWCATWLGQHGNWPPQPVLAAHHNGTRITPTLIARLTRSRIT